jgi:disulfide bond formation protein DsbB
MIDLIAAILIAGLAAFLALFVVSFMVLGLIFGIVHLFVMVLYDPRDDRATVHQKQTV